MGGEPRRHPRGLRRRHRLSRRARAQDGRDDPRARASSSGRAARARTRRWRRRGSGAEVSFITRLGEDAFADMAFRTWAEAGVKPAVTRAADSYTGAAYIFIEEATGDNAIIICPGAAATIAPADLDARAGLIADASVFVTQLEQPLEAAVRGLEIARDNGVTTILNPAPGRELPDSVLGALRLPDAERDRGGGTDGHAGRRRRGARAAAERLRERGVGAVVMTLGAQGRAPARPRPFGAGAGDPRRAGGGDDRGRRRLQRRLRHRPRPRHGPGRGGSLRLRRRGHLGDPARDGAVDADAGRGRGAAGARLMGVGVHGGRGERERFTATGWGWSARGSDRIGVAFRRLESRLEWGWKGGVPLFDRRA